MMMHVCDLGLFHMHCSRVVAIAQMGSSPSSGQASPRAGQTQLQHRHKKAYKADARKIALWLLVIHDMDNLRNKRL